MTITFSGGLSATGEFEIGPAIVPLLEITPPDLSNLVLWLDAADESSITLVSGEVDIWADKDTSSEANDFTPEVASFRPGYNLSELNDLPGVDFTENNNISLRDDVISNTELDNVFNGGGYLICVIKGGDATSTVREIFRKNSGWILFAKGTPSGNFVKWQMNNFFTGSASQYKMTNFDAPIDTAFILEVQYTQLGPNVPILRVNGTNSSMDDLGGGAGDPSDDSGNVITMGATWDGSMYEILLYDSIPSSEDQTSLRNQLTTKWDL